MVSSNKDKSILNNLIIKWHLRLKRHLILICLLLFSLSNYAQPTSQLAYKYYQDKEFDKASVMYQKLFNQSGSSIYHTYYINCLIQLEDFKTAEKSTKGLIRKESHNLAHYVTLGYIYKSQNKADEATRQFDNVIKKISPDHRQIHDLANAFITNREYEFAEKTYLKGRKVLRNNFIFNFELANIYVYQQNYQKMIDEYLALLSKKDSYIQSVQNRLQNAVYSDTDNNLNNLLKAAFLKSRLLFLV